MNYTNAFEIMQDFAKIIAFASIVVLLAMLVDGMVRVKEVLRPNLSVSFCGCYRPSHGCFPYRGGAGADRNIQKGDTWEMIDTGEICGMVIKSGQYLKARSDNPGQSPSNWIVVEWCNAQDFK